MSKSGPRDNILAVATDLFAEAGDVDIDGAVEDIGFVFPYAGEDLVAGEYLADAWL